MLCSWGRAQSLGSIGGVNIGLLKNGRHYLLHDENMSKKVQLLLPQESRLRQVYLALTCHTFSSTSLFVFLSLVFVLSLLSVHKSKLFINLLCVVIVARKRN